MRYTKSKLHKLETLFSELNYTVRYEKGTFQSGYCLVQNRKIVIINRFFDTEARINCLLEILSRIHEDLTQLSDESKEFMKEIDLSGKESGQYLLEKSW